MKNTHAPNRARRRTRLAALVGSSVLATALWTGLAPGAPLPDAFAHYCRATGEHTCGPCTSGDHDHLDAKGSCVSSKTPPPTQD